VTLSATGDLRDIRMDHVGRDVGAQLRRGILAAHERAMPAIREPAVELMRPVQEPVGRINQVPG
jgi:hypothetical protein